MTNPHEAKEEFYSKLRKTIREAPPLDKLILTGNFDARVGAVAETWPSVIIKSGMGRCN